MRSHSYTLTNKDMEYLSCFLYNDSISLPAAVFAHFPLRFKRHCVQVGAVAGLMAKYAPEDAIPQGMTRNDYANAVRYGGIYHDIGAYLVYNQWKMYPDAGERFLREQISEHRDAAARQVILETVRHCGERYDGKGYPDGLSGGKIPLCASLCAISDVVNDIAAKRRSFITGSAVAKAEQYVQKNSEMYAPAAIRCFMDARDGIRYLYDVWRKRPPIWFNHDIEPLAASIERAIG